jgi:hypothetical protein
MSDFSWVVAEENHGVDRAGKIDEDLAVIKPCGHTFFCGEK